MSPSFGVRGRTEKKKIPTRSAGEKKETPLGQTMEKKFKLTGNYSSFPLIQAGTARRRRRQRPKGCNFGGGIKEGEK